MNRTVNDGVDLRGCSEAVCIRLDERVNTFRRRRAVSVNLKQIHHTSNKGKHQITFPMDKDTSLHLRFICSIIIPRESF